MSHQSFLPLLASIIHVCLAGTFSPTCQHVHTFFLYHMLCAVCHITRKHVLCVVLSVLYVHHMCEGLLESVRVYVCV